MSMIVRASESLHWYTREGAPMYQVQAAKGGMRATTLRDARKLNLVPSVTTIMSCAAKPGLEAWKLNQMLLAALTLPKAPEETMDSYAHRVAQDSKEQARAAAERGTEIHAALEGWYEGTIIGDKVDYQTAVAEAIKKEFGDHNWSTEKSFASKLGYGGKVDLHTKDGDGIVIDFKTKDFGPDDKVDAYSDNAMQLAAYRVGLGLLNAECANVFVSRNHPGLIKMIKWSQEDLKKHWSMFVCLLYFWKFKNDYEPPKNLQLIDSEGS